MIVNEWALSFRLAWARLSFRLFGGLTLLATICGSAFFLTRLLRGATSASTIVLHYNVYLGIDNVQMRLWAFLLPGIWMCSTFLNLLLASCSYRRDREMALSLLLFSFFSCFVWMIVLFYLSLVNG